jgi:hypothetical protein
MTELIDLEAERDGGNQNRKGKAEIQATKRLQITKPLLHGKAVTKPLPSSFLFRPSFICAQT